MPKPLITEASFSTKDILLTSTVGLFSLGTATLATRWLKKYFRMNSDKKKELLGISLKSSLTLAKEQQSKKTPDYFATHKAYQDAIEVLEQLKILGDSEEEKSEINRLLENCYGEIAKASYFRREYTEALSACTKLKEINENSRESFNIQGLVNLIQALFHATPTVVDQFFKNAHSAFQSSLLIDKNQNDIMVLFNFTEQKLDKAALDINKCLVICHRIELLFNEEGLQSEWKSELTTIYSFLSDELLKLVAFTAEEKAEFLKKRVDFYNMAINYTPDAIYLEHEKLFLWRGGKIALEHHRDNTYTTPDEQKSEAFKELNIKINKYDRESNLGYSVTLPKPTASQKPKPVKSSSFFARPLPVRSDVIVGGLTLLMFLVTNKLVSRIDPEQFLMMALSVKQQTGDWIGNSADTIKRQSPTLRK